MLSDPGQNKHSGSSMPSLIVIACVGVVCILGLYRYIIYPVFLSPLAKVPSAHWSSSVTPLWILIQRRRGRENPMVHAAHERLGSLVRLGPNEIAVNCVDGGIRTIYGGGYEKGSWYSVFTNYGVENTFSSLQRGPHSARKRMLSNVYAKSTLQASASMAGIAESLMCHRLTPRLAASSGKAVEAYEVFAGAAMDFVTAYIFGLAQASNFMQDPDHCKQWVINYKARQEFIFWPQELPGLVTFAKRLGIKHWLVPKWVDKANEDIEAWVMSLCDAAEKVHVNSADGKTKNVAVVYNQLRSMLKKANGDKDPHAPLTAKERLDIASELLDHAAAGFDTTSITLTYLAWELSKPENKDLQSALRKELNGCSPMYRPASGDTEVLETPDFKHLDNLPILHAVVMESLRLHAAIPGAQPRVTPEKAELGDAESMVKGLRAGTRVNSYAYSLHLNEQVFPEASKWRPQRWLDERGEVDPSGEKSRWFWAFGSGGRMCIGSNLAMADMKCIVAAIWANFATTILDDTGMTHNGGYTSEPLGSPEGNYLLLNFLPTQM
ncbi:putative cytochrome P450 monooxygenase [Myriangium duriaei CBS 260.36]|uniref:Cytochrome P450 monooxygenase n=1 Tax=Myriangium duriaei CBS 260.36 TaxID=1168546 RepID=A0A9P4J7P3_9PEZI|nr:putative cytochrome P450 monooxygenase [Myriangium duriaei CBS 260.36]